MAVRIIFEVSNNLVSGFFDEQKYETHWRLLMLK